MKTTGLRHYSGRRTVLFSAGNCRPLVLAAVLSASSVTLAAPITSYSQASIHVRDCLGACFTADDRSLAFAYDEDLGQTGLSAAATCQHLARHFRSPQLSCHDSAKKRQLQE